MLHNYVKNMWNDTSCNDVIYCIIMYTNYYNSKNYDGGENNNTVNVHDDDEAYN